MTQEFVSSNDYAEGAPNQEILPADSNPNTGWSTPLTQTDDEAAGEEDGKFHKLLDSEVSDEKTLELLTHTQKTFPMLRDFSDDELEGLGSDLSVLKFEAGETIMKQGENASFCAVLLQGGLRVHVSPTFNIVLAAGIFSLCSRLFFLFSLCSPLDLCSPIFFFLCSLISHLVSSYSSCFDSVLFVL